jgi:hypothetical protein
MSWVNRQAPLVPCDGISPTLSPELLAPVQVRALKPFVFGANIAPGDRFTMPRHRAEYAQFLGLVTLNVHGEQ